MSGSIIKNKIYFESCLDTAKALFDEGLYEDCGLYLEGISSFAWRNFTGYYTSWKLENLLNLLGNQIASLPPSNTKKSETKGLSILHIVSEVYETGGHTKLLLNWVELDKDNKHTLVSTRMKKSAMIEKIGDFSLKNTTTSIKCLKSTDLLSKASELKQIVKDGYDKIILHIHPDDVIPIIALSDNKITTPVLFLNHADHIFWIGMSVIDCLIQIREPNINIDRERRGAELQRFLPIPINEEQKTFHAEEVKITKKEKEVILLSTGAEYKYKPFEKHNFFKAVFKVVESFENVRFLIAGVFPENEYAKKYIHPRILYLGQVNNLDQYEDLCDIYVEGFPMASFTALLQPAKKGKYLQLMYQPIDIFRLFDNNEESELVYPISYDHWFEQLSNAIDNFEKRTEKSRKQYEYINKTYSVGNWKNLLNTIYSDTNEISHKIRKHTKDVFYFTNSENFLESLNHKIKIHHYKYCSKLSFKERFKVVLRAQHKTKEVFVGIRTTWRFLRVFKN